MTAYYTLKYMGETLDEFDSTAAAQLAKDALIEDIFAGRLPDFLTAEDFLSRREAKQLIYIQMEEDE